MAGSSDKMSPEPPGSVASSANWDPQVPQSLNNPQHKEPSVASITPRRPPARMRRPARHRTKLVFPVVSRIAVKARRPQIRIVRLALVAVIVEPGRPAPDGIELKLHQIPRIVRQTAAVPVQVIAVSPRAGVAITWRPAHRRIGSACRHLRIRAADRTRTVHVVHVPQARRRVIRIRRDAPMHTAWTVRTPARILPLDQMTRVAP